MGDNFQDIGNLGGSENETKKNIVFLVSIHQENKKEELKKKINKITLFFYNSVIRLNLCH